MDTAAEGVLRRLPLKGTRGTIARRMRESAATKPQVTLHARANLDPLLALLEERRPAWEAAAGVPVGLNASLSRLVALAAARDPRLNGHVEESAVTLYRCVHLGVAVALEEGLIVPVLKDAQNLGVPSVARTLADLTERAQARRLTMDDVTGGTLTITNLGMYGVESFNPLVNPPQIAIVGVAALRQETVVRNNEVQIARLLPLSLTFDHAAVDGAQAAEWLRLLVSMIEDARESLKEDDA